MNTNIAVEKVRELTEPELLKQLDDSRRELLNLKIQARIGQLQNTALIPAVRRTVARLLTVQCERLKAHN
jgi:large subunit ribosomal protein L29